MPGDPVDHPAGDSFVLRSAFRPVPAGATVIGENMRDPYAVLGVKRDADAGEIKSAWRNLAKKIHPDQNRNDPLAAKRFAEAGEAYETLRDPQKRSRYDMLSQAGVQGATIQQQREAAREAAAKRKAAEENARRVMEELAKAEAERARKAEAQAQTQAQAQASAEKPQPSAQQKAQSDAAEADGKKSGAESAEDVINRIFGAQPQFSAEAGAASATASASREHVQEPEGTPSGSANAGEPLPLAAVKAIGAFIRRITGGKDTSEKAPDQLAEARVTIEDLLKEAFVTVSLPEGRDLRFRLDQGLSDGDVVRLKGQGFKVPGMQRGDALVTVRIAPDPQFRVSGHDIVTMLPVPLENAVLGCTAEVASPTGPVQITVPAWSNSDQTIRMPGLGLFDGKGGRGDLLVEIRIMLWEKPDAKVTDLMRSMREGLYL